MRRRYFLVGLLPPAFFASSQVARTAAKPWPDGELLQSIFLHGAVRAVHWADPLPWLELVQAPSAQSALRPMIRSAKTQHLPAWAMRLLRDVTVPVAAGSARWRVDLPSLERLAAAGVRRPETGEVVSVAGPWRPPLTGTSTLAAEVLFAAGRIHAFP